MTTSAWSTGRRWRSYGLPWSVTQTLPIISIGYFRCGYVRLFAIGNEKAEGGGFNIAPLSWEIYRWRRSNPYVSHRATHYRILWWRRSPSWGAGHFYTSTTNLAQRTSLSGDSFACCVSEPERFWYRRFFKYIVSTYDAYDQIIRDGYYYRRGESLSFVNLSCNAMPYSRWQKSVWMNPTVYRPGRKWGVGRIRVCVIIIDPITMWREQLSILTESSIVNEIMDKATVLQFRMKDNHCPNMMCGGMVCIVTVFKDIIYIWKRCWILKQSIWSLLKDESLKPSFFTEEKELPWRWSRTLG